METAVAELLDIYFLKESWHKKKLTLTEANKYYEFLFQNDNIVTAQRDGRIIGYAEFWCVSLKQLQLIANDLPFHIAEQDIKHGHFCYIHSLWIDDLYRGAWILKELKEKVNQKTRHCEYWAGVRSQRDEYMRIKIKSVIRG